jgi:hypothetical protein
VSRLNRGDNLDENVERSSPVKRITLWSAAGAALVLAVAVVVSSQQQRASPHETTSGTVAGAKIGIDYGRPYVKGRVIWGGLNPWNRVWRLGADEATTLTTDMALQFGTLRVPAGRYTLYMWVSESDPRLIINRQTGQWGTEYDEKQDLGRVALTRTAATPPVEQLTIAIEPQGAGGVLRITWADRQYSAPFTVVK